MTDEEWRGRVDGRLQAIETRLITVETSNAVEEVHRNNVERRLGGIEDSMKWLTRLILGALIMAELAFALGAGFVL